MLKGLLSFRVFLLLYEQRINIAIKNCSFGFYVNDFFVKFINGLKLQATSQISNYNTKFLWDILKCVMHVSM